jgi:GTP-binding protein
VTSRRSNDESLAPWAILDAELVALASTVSQLPEPAGAEIAFAGRSNVGKSSLMNALLGRRRLVRTSSTPGCTRAIGFFRARARDGTEHVLVDLPGYGYAQRSRTERAAWGELIDSYLAHRDALCAVVVLIDARHGTTDADQRLFELLGAVRGGGRPIVVAATKLDKVPASRRHAALAALGRTLAQPVVGVSAVTGDGIGRLWQALRQATAPAQ